MKEITKLVSALNKLGKNTLAKKIAQELGEELGFSLDAVAKFINDNLVKKQYFQYTKGIDDLEDLVMSAHEDPALALDYYDEMMERLDMRLEESEEDSDKSFDQRKADFLITLSEEKEKIVREADLDEEGKRWLILAIKNFLQATAASTEGEWSDSFGDSYYQS